MRKRWYLSLILLISCLGSVVHAQSFVSPLILHIHGDFWSWAGGKSGLQQRTNWGHNLTPVLSPGGNLIAYKATAAFAVQAQGDTGGADLPGNIWVLDIRSGNTRQLAKQPDNASISDSYILRSMPTWSPDGSAVAWTEFVVNTRSTLPEMLRLVIYDLNAGKATVIVPELPVQNSRGTIPVQWGSPGLAVKSTPRVTENTAPQDSLLVYRPDGGLISTTAVGTLIEYSWIKDGEHEAIAIFPKNENSLSDPQWLLLDPMAGKITPMFGIPELYSLDAPNGVTMSPASLGTSPEWQITDPGGAIVRLGNVDDVYTFTPVLAISPDGRMLAYIKQGSTFIYQDKQVLRVNSTDVGALLWGPVGWRVRRYKAA